MNWASFWKECVSEITAAETDYLIIQEVHSERPLYWEYIKINSELN